MIIMDSGNVVMTSSKREYFWSFSGLFLIPVFTIWGNVLVCVSVYMEKRLQNRFNFFLVSLAISDLLCALLVMPVSAWNMVKSSHSEKVPRGFCLAWYSLDVFFTSSTIIHLCSISLDRFFVLSNPLKYHNTKVRSSLPLMIAPAWLIPFCIACPLFIFSLSLENVRKSLLLNVSSQSPPSSDSYKGCGPHNASFIITSTVITFLLPLVIMIATYVLTVLSIVRQTTQARKNLHSGVAHPKTLSNKKIIAIDQQSNNVSQSSLSINSVDSNIYEPSRHHGSVLSNHLHVPLLPIRRSLDSSRLTPVTSRRSSIRSSSSFNGSTKATSWLGSSDQFQNSAKRTLAAMNSGKKAVQVLGILFALFLLCYLPFFVLYLLDFFCTSCRHTTGPLVPKTEWVAYVASMLNPIVYHIFNPTFRKTFNRLMRGDCFRVRKTPAKCVV